MIERALNTQIIDDTIPLEEGVYIYGTFEERSSHFSSVAYSKISFLKIEETTTTEIMWIESNQRYSKNIAGLSELVEKIDKDLVYLDITGLSHSVWAPLIKCLLEAKKKFSVIYVEPLDYRKSLTPDTGEIYDLSEEILGISPIPGFATFLNEDENYLFIPLLGFEGTRFSFMLNNVQPTAFKIFPIIGVPGFRLEYPFISYESNRFSLLETKSWRNVIYSPADCPFSVFKELEKLHKDFPDAGLKIALIGTKPHALGAILFRLAYPDVSEILYDHPIRKKQRTIGASKEHIYDVSGFLNSTKPIADLQKQGKLR